MLVVDDMEDNRDLYASYFEFFGYAVEQAADGQDALAKIAERTPDVVIMDLAMPRMDGWEATRRIKANPATNGIPVVILTGHVTPTNIEKAWAAGADDICPKPCRPEQVLDRVQRLLRQR